MLVELYPKQRYVLNFSVEIVTFHGFNEWKDKNNTRFPVTLAHNGFYDESK